MSCCATNTILTSCMTSCSSGPCTGSRTPLFPCGWTRASSTAPCTWSAARPCAWATSSAMISTCRSFTVINSNYQLGVDGISLPIVLVTTILIPLALLFSFSITERVKAYMILFLLLETGLLGVFMSLDLVLFFLFWEVGLIPMYFLINIWGSANRQYASFKFFIYTMAGSVGLLLAVQTIGLSLGTFDMTQAFARWP